MLALLEQTGLVAFEVTEVGEVFGFARGKDGNAVRGGEDPGLFPIAGTIPTMPPVATAVSDGRVACAIDVEFWIELT